MQPIPDRAIKSENIHFLPIGAPLGYFLNVPFLRCLLNQIKPDLVNAHRASGYGTLTRLSGFHPFVLTIWGNDIYDFPTRSPLARYLASAALQSADKVCSTSYAMARRAYEICTDISDLSVVPWGVDTIGFSPRKIAADQDVITVGTVKTMSPKYGIDLLIRAFAIVQSRLAIQQSEYAGRIRLLIVGDGPKRTKSEEFMSRLKFLGRTVAYATDELQNLKALADQVGVGHLTTFLGALPYENVPDVLRKMDIFAAPSRVESFGVAVVEACACGLPVAVADVGGLPEVVVPGETGLIFRGEDVDALARSLEQLITQPALRERLGQAGRKRVLEKYKWSDSVLQMEEVFRSVLKQVH
jgi:glycosyltransferase involved in cell wall biosynthesis